jgi:hypothetical protein
MESKNSYQPTRQEVNRVTRDTLKNNNINLSPAVQSQLADQISKDINNAGANGSNVAFQNDQGGKDKTALGPATGPTKSEANWNKALSGMAGAKSSGLVSNAASRSPAGQGVVNSDEKPTLKVTVASNELKNIETILAQQLSNKIGDSFKLEIVTPGTNEIITYDVNKSANGLVVSLVGTSSIGQQYLNSVQKVVNKLYGEKQEPRLATRLSLLQALGSKTPQN